MLFHNRTQTGEKLAQELGKLAPIVADKEIDQIVTLTRSKEQPFSPADYYKEFTDLTDDDVIQKLSRAGAKAETKRKRPCALQLHRGVYYSPSSSPAGRDLRSARDQ